MQPYIPNNTVIVYPSVHQHPMRGPWSPRQPSNTIGRRRLSAFEDLTPILNNPPVDRHPAVRPNFLPAPPPDERLKTIGVPLETEENRPLTKLQDDILNFFTQKMDAQVIESQFITGAVELPAQVTDCPGPLLSPLDEWPIEKAESRILVERTLPNQPNRSSPVVNTRGSPKKVLSSKGPAHAPAALKKMNSLFPQPLARKNTEERSGPQEEISVKNCKNERVSSEISEKSDIREKDYRHISALILLAVEFERLPSTEASTDTKLREELTLSKKKEEFYQDQIKKLYAEQADLLAQLSLLKQRNPILLSDEGRSTDSGY